MTTIHLYPLQSVVATLLYALQTGNAILAYRCANELKESKEHALLWNILTFAWILHNPDDSHERLRYEQYLSGNHQLFLESLLNSPFSLPEFYQYGYIPPPKAKKTEPETMEWKKLPTTWTPDQCYQLWRTNVAALEKGHWSKALRLTLPLLQTDCESIVDMLHTLNMKSMAELLESAVYMPFAQRVLAHAFASYKQIKQTKQTQIKIDSTIRSIWGNSAYTGGKKGRTFQVLKEAHALWSIPINPMCELTGLPVLIANDDTTKYWKEIQEQYGYTNKLEFKDDTKMEEFYTNYFPDDIPDEWSLEERSKSHGIDSCVPIENNWISAFVILGYNSTD